MQKRRLISESTKKLLEHVKKLRKSKLVQAKRLGYNVTRYYPKAIKANESDLLDHLLNSTRRRIIFFYLSIATANSKKSYALYIGLALPRYFNFNVLNVLGLSLFREKIKRIN